MSALILIASVILTSQPASDGHQALLAAALNPTRHAKEEINHVR